MSEILTSILHQNDIVEVTEAWLDQVADSEITDNLLSELSDYYAEDLKNEDLYVELADLLFDELLA